MNESNLRQGCTQPQYLMYVMLGLLCGTLYNIIKWFYTLVDYFLCRGKSSGN